jgi:hypothetical protein
MDFTTFVLALRDMSGLETIGAVIVLLILSYLPYVIKNYKKKKKGHASCENFPDLKYWVDKAIKRAIRIFEIKTYETLSDQMGVVDRVSSQIKTVLMDHYKTLVYNSRDIRAYSKILYYTGEKLKYILKEWIKANHILEKTDTEFMVYVKDTTKNLITEHASLLDKEYASEDFEIDRDTLKKENYSAVIPKIEYIIEKCLYDIRIIAREKKKEIDEINKLAEIELESDDVI